MRDISSISGISMFSRGIFMQGVVRGEDMYGRVDMLAIWGGPCCLW